MSRLKRTTRKADVTGVPTSIEIVSRKILIQADDDCEDLGQWDSSSQLITYAPEQEIGQLRDTIWHEILHAIIEDINGDEIKEKALRRAATVTLHTLRHNPALRDFLFAD
jgi:hypothetical protein